MLVLLLILLMIILLIHSNSKRKTGQKGNVDTKSVEIMVPLVYLSNFCRTLEIPLINCEAIKIL